jgi:hypothetical protein
VEEEDEMKGKRGHFQLILWPVFSDCGCVNDELETEGWLITFWKPKFSFGRATGNIARIYKWFLCLGYLEIRRWT